MKMNIGRDWKWEAICIDQSTDQSGSHFAFQYFRMLIKKQKIRNCKSHTYPEKHETVFHFEAGKNNVDGDVQD